MKQPDDVYVRLAQAREEARGVHHGCKEYYKEKCKTCIAAMNELVQAAIAVGKHEAKNQG